MANLLVSSGLQDEAEALLIQMMDKTTAPYYFMIFLGNLKSEAGEPEQALLWFRRGYQSSTGSRFRWGSMYLTQLIEVAPDDETLGHDSSWLFLAQGRQTGPSVI